MPRQDIISPEEFPTLDAAFLERVRRTPDVPAYHQYLGPDVDWQVITWREAAAHTARWRAALQGEGLAPGDRVAVALRNCPEWVYFDMAAHSLGLVVVPLYTDDRPDNMAYVLEDSGARLLLVQDRAGWDELRPHLGALDALQRVVMWARRGPVEVADDPRIVPLDGWLPERAEPLQPGPGNPDALASIVYTSGTTGRPKGVMLSHRNMLFVAFGGLQLVDVYVDDVLLSFLPLSHTLERSAGYYLAVLAGASVAYARSVAQLAGDLQHVRPTLLIAVPRVFERVYRRIHQQVAVKGGLSAWLFHSAVRVGWRRFQHRQGRARWTPALVLWPLFRRVVAAKVAARLGGRLRLAVSGGAPLGEAVARLFIGLDITVLQGYGLTETSPVISVNTPENNDPRSVGVPLPGVEVVVGNDQELLVRGPGVMLGYWNNPEATRAVIDDQGWLHTGDQARLDGGRVYIIGRIKDILVLSNGEKVPPGDMEAAILLDGLFEQALIVGEGEAFLTAIVVLEREAWRAYADTLGLDPDDAASPRDKRVRHGVMERIAKQLQDFPGYAKVRRVVVSLEPWTIDRGLLTPTLKVKRKQVLEHYAEDLAAIYHEDGSSR